VTLKVFDSKLTTDESDREVFVREATTAIDCPHVATITAAGFDEVTSRPWLAMPELRGDTLAAFIAKHGKLDPKSAILILGKVAEALEAAHLAGVIHRSLSPHNLFVERTPDGTLSVTVIDFALASRDSSARTAARAPEEGKGTLTPAADVWAFGLVAFYALVGCDLHASVPSNVSIPSNAPVPNPMTIAKDAGVTLPIAFEAWFSGAVVRDPLARFQTVSDAWLSLERLLLAPPDAPLVVLEAPSLPNARRSGQKPPSWPLVAGGGSLALVLVVGALASRGWNDTDVEQPAASESAAVSVHRPSPLPRYDLPEVDLDASAALTPPPAPIDAGDPLVNAVNECLAKDDTPCARNVLEPPVFAQNATPFQAQVLYDLCQVGSDVPCMKTVISKYPTLDHADTRTLTVRVGNSTTLPKSQLRGQPGSVAAKARVQMVDDPKGARRLLQPRVYAQLATPEEARLLREICEFQHDAPCNETIAELYPNLGR
jgi:serine/threonine-protein kinase